jgi:hypothetical protein
MPRIRLIMLSLLAVCALSAVTASASSALEKYEFLKEGKGIGGETFKGKQVGNSILKATGLEITCTSGSSEGTFAANTSKIEKVKVTFKGCKGGACKVSNKGNPNEEEIKTEAIKGTLGETTIGALESNVGIDLEPEGTTTFVELEGHPTGCGIPLTKLKGSVIGEVTPVNTSTKIGTLKFKEAGGVQEIQNIEEEGSEGVVDNGDVLTGFTGNDRLINETTIELTSKAAFEVHASE